VKNSFSLHIQISVFYASLVHEERREEMRRADREITDPPEIQAALKRFKVCRLGLASEGKMRIVSMCFGHHEGFLYLHSAPEGEKIDMLKGNPGVVFEMGRILELVGRDDIHYESLMGEGTVTFLESIEEKRKGMAILQECFSGVADELSDRALNGTCVLMVKITALSMKRNPASWNKPVLETERLILRTLERGDEEVLRRAADYRDIAQGTLCLPHPYTLRDAENFIEGRFNDFLGKTGGVFGVLEKETGEFIGCIGIAPTIRNSAEIGYWITPSRWNRGYCTEAVKRLLVFGFQEMGLERICALHFPENPGSGQVLEKAGMVREGVLRGYLKKDGVRRDAVLWGILRND